MSDILSIVGLVVGILGVIITVSIFCVQNCQTVNERRIQELLKLQEELLKCKSGCDELGNYNWYRDMKFSFTVRELDHAINELETKIRLFKNEKYVYIQRYDNELMQFINNNIKAIEVSIRELNEVADLQEAFIKHHSQMMNIANDENWELYEKPCDIINNVLGAFRAFSQKIQQDNEHIQDMLEKRNYRENILELQFEPLDMDVLQMEIDKSKREKI